MPYIHAYTKHGDDYHHIDISGFEHVGLGCDVNHAMHLALSRDGKTFTPLRNNTGVLFPEATFNEGKVQGTTKTMLFPWLFRFQDGTFGVCAVRRNQYAPDPLSIGCMMLYRSKNLVRYEFDGFLRLDDSEEIMNPRCRWDDEKSAYYLEWETEKGLFCGYTKHFKEVWDVSASDKTNFAVADSYIIPDTNPGNVIEISEEEAEYINRYFGIIYNTGVAPMEYTVKVGKAPGLADLPKATCLYNDGSTHDKAVNWDKNIFDKIDFSKPGEYELSGEVYQKEYPFPVMSEFISDPSILYYKEKFYLLGTGERSVSFRVSDTIDGLFTAEPIEVYKIPDSDTEHSNMWAPELHIINGIPYVFTTVGKHQWYTVRSHVLRCTGDPANPNDWEAPRLVLKPDGTELNEKGISLDMTYFCVDGVHYVMWSNRIILGEGDSYGSIYEPADIHIATIDPDEPWQLTTNPVQIIRPKYGWDRMATEVDEGPYMIRNGDDLFVSISGSSTGLSHLYCVGLLHAKRGNNLLSSDGWDWLPYPVLTKESVENELGPGHNNFVKDPDSGDDLMIYHAVPGSHSAEPSGRRMGIRRVHWGANGYPYLEMTPERDLNPKFKKVTLKITVK